MTSTQILSASVGSTGAYGTNSTKTTLQAGTTSFSLSFSLTNGVLSTSPMLGLRCYIACTSFDITTAQAVSQLRNTAAVYEIRPASDGSGVTIEVSPMFARTGTYLYTWYEEAKLPAAATLVTRLDEIN